MQKVSTLRQTVGAWGSSWHKYETKEQFEYLAYIFELIGVKDDDTETPEPEFAHFNTSSGQ